MPSSIATLPRALALVALAATVGAGRAHAQSAALPAEIVSAKQSLTADQRKQVAGSTEALARRFAEADPAGVVAVRNELVTLMRNPLTGIGFRRDFGAEFVKSFRPFTQGTDSLRATNAFIVARFIATAESIDFLADSLAPESQPEVAIRVAASSQLPKAIDAAPLSPPQLDAIAKRLANVARQETDWVAVSHEVDAMTQMLREEGLPTAQSEAIAMSLAGTINDLTNRVIDGSQPRLVNSLQRALLAVRNQLSGVAGSARSRLLTAIAPSLESLVKLKGAPPTTVAAVGLAGTFDAVANTAGLLQKLRVTGGTG